MRRAPMLIAIAVTAALAAPAAARAAITASAVATPPDGTYRTVTGEAWPWVADPLHVTGTTTGADPGAKVDLLCTTGTNYARMLAGGVPVTGNTFSADVTSSDFPSGRCRLRALPTGTNHQTTDLTPFTGPVLTFDWLTTHVTPAGHPSGGIREDFFVAHQQARGFADYDSLFGCGLCDMRLSFPGGRGSEFVFYENAYLDPVIEAPLNRSGLRIDGRNAWGSYVANADVDPTANYSSAYKVLTGVPSVEVDVQRTPGSDLRLAERQDLVRCRDADPWPLDAASCGAFTGAGVRLDRTIHQTREGTVVRVTDVFRSTDGAAHTLDLLWSNWFDDQPGSPLGYRFAWTGEPYAAHDAPDVIGAAREAPAVVFIRSRMDRPDGDERFPQAAMLLDRAPGAALFTRHDAFHLPMRVEVPAGGAATVRHAFVMAVTTAELRDFVEHIEDEWVLPTVAITSPDDGQAVTEPRVTVTGTARDDRGVELTVNGRPVAVAADGTWSIQLDLVAGNNGVSAAVRDRAGNTATAHRVVRYVAPLPAPDVVAPVLSAVRLTPTRFRVGTAPTAVLAAKRTPRGTTVHFVLSEPAEVTFTVLKPVAGRRVAGKCRKATRALRRRPACLRLDTLGIIRRRAVPGPGALRFSGRIGRKALAPRAYRMVLAAVDRAGNRSQPHTLRFTITRR